MRQNKKAPYAKRGNPKTNPKMLRKRALAVRGYRTDGTHEDKGPWQHERNGNSHMKPPKFIVTA